VSERTIADDEVLYRRIPPGKDWFEPPDRISSLNFKLNLKLHPDELGISVYRARAVDVATVLSKPEAKPGSEVAQTTVGQIRAARDKEGNPLDLDVVPVKDENDPGHAEIRGTILREKPKSVAKTLRKLFKLAGSTPGRG
jgi:hypothetical protein